MMSGHLTQSQIRNYQKRILSPSEIKPLIAHTTECEECRQRLAGALSLEQVKRRVLVDVSRARSLLFNEHLSDEIKAAYADNVLSEAERHPIETHLAACPQCRAEVAEVRSLLSLIEDVPASPTLGAKPTSLWNIFFQWLTKPPVRTKLQASGFALATGLMAFIVTRSYYLHSGQQKRLDPEEIASRQAALNQKESAIQEQKRSLTEQQQAVAIDLKKVERAKAVLKADQKQFAVLQREIVPASKLPAPSQLSAPVVPENGIHIVTLAAAPKKNDLHKEKVPFALLSPLPGQSVCHDTLTFRWQPPAHSAGKSLFYKVEFSGKGIPSKESPPQKKTQWTPNLKDRLLPGQTYSWKVFVYTNAKSLEPSVQSPNAEVEFKFRTLSSKERQRLQAARPSLLPYGIALMQSGLFTEAEQVFAAALVASPGDKPVQALLARTRELRAKWLRQTRARLEHIPASTGSKAMRVEIMRQLSLKEENTP